MFKLDFKDWLKKSYVYVILMLFYVPLFFAAIFSLSKGSRRSDMPFDFAFTGEGWKYLIADKEIFSALLVTFNIAWLVILLVVSISLLTVYALWRQKSKFVKGYTSATYNVPLINPDIITGISIAIMYITLFGLQSMTKFGYIRVVLAQTTMILPFGITIMHPKSEKFNISLMEASKDLGFGPISTWFRTYFRHMLPVVIATAVVAFVLSSDDFIITRLLYDSTKQSIGSLMYSGKLEPWVLAIGTFMLIISLTGTTIYTFRIYKKERKFKNKI